MRTSSIRLLLGCRWRETNTVSVLYCCKPLCAERPEDITQAVAVGDEGSELIVFVSYKQVESSAFHRAREAYARVSAWENYSHGYSVCRYSLLAAGGVR